MPKIQYQTYRFGKARLELIDKVNELVANYSAQGLSLTLRQVYYRLVAAGIIENTQRSYKNLGNLINDARLAGKIDWYAIEDRTRNLSGRYSYQDLGDFMVSEASSFHLNYWTEQDTYIEVWVEKDALKGVVGQACYPIDVDFFSCRGYTSQSEMWGAAQRLINRSKYFERVVILHFGDHDPSGIDMSRDIQDRMELFGVRNLEFKRMALNMDQVEQYNPPPNPAKVTDSRYDGYVDEFGEECWELDALEPSVIKDLITSQVIQYRDEELFQMVKQEEEDRREFLKEVARNWQVVENNWDAIMEDYDV